MNRSGLRVRDYTTARYVLALYVDGDRLHAGALRLAASIVIGLGCPSRQYELVLF
jgi:hypothetical protein